MAVETPPLTEKELALEVLRQMPENITLQQISDELAILAAIREGEDDADADRVISHDEVRQRSAAWTSK